MSSNEKINPKPVKPRLNTPPPSVMKDRKKEEARRRCRTHKGRHLLNREKDE